MQQNLTPESNLSNFDLNYSSYESSHDVLDKNSSFTTSWLNETLLDNDLSDFIGDESSNEKLSQSTGQCNLGEQSTICQEQDISTYVPDFDIGVLEYHSTKPPIQEQFNAATSITTTTTSFNAQTQQIQPPQKEKSKKTTKKQLQQQQKQQKQQQQTTQTNGFKEQSPIPSPIQSPVQSPIQDQSIRESSIEFCEPSAAKLTNRQFSSEEERLKYLKRRANNNQAAKNSRKKKQEKEEENTQYLQQLIQENKQLKEDLLKFQTEVLVTRQTLNMFIQSVARTNPAILMTSPFDNNNTNGIHLLSQNSSNHQQIPSPSDSKKK